MFSLTRVPQPNFNWHGDIDNLFSGLFAPVTRDRAGNGGGAAEVFMPALDIVETDAGYEVSADLPGVNKEDLSVHTKENLLIIEAQSRDESVEKEGGKVIARERRSGKYRRALRLGDAVDESAISARYHDGVLKVTLPRAAKAASKKVEVEVH